MFEVNWYSDVGCAYTDERETDKEIELSISS